MKKITSTATMRIILIIINFKHISSEKTFECVLSINERFFRTVISIYTHFAQNLKIECQILNAIKFIAVVVHV